MMHNFGDVDVFSGHRAPVDGEIRCSWRVGGRFHGECLEVIRAKVCLGMEVEDEGGPRKGLNDMEGF